jgi:hypothetical protein
MPFWVLHGDGAWKPLLVAFVVATLGVIALVRKLVAMQRARAATRELDRDRGDGVLRGTLGGGGVATLSVRRRMTLESVIALHRDRELWIDTTEGRIALVGDVRAVSGSRVTTSRGGLATRTPESLRDRLTASDGKPDQIHLAILCELSPGDRVVARGELVREASSEPTDYRESRVVSSLRAGDDRPIVIAARGPRASAPRLPLLGTAMIAVVTAITGYVIEGGLGDMWRHDCFGDLSSRDRPDDVVLSNTHACVLANAMPRQPYVLEHYLDRLDRTPTTSDDDARDRLELARFSGGCEATLRRLRPLPRPDLQLAEAKRCHDPAMQQLALMNLGKFDDAAKLGPLDDRGAGSLLVLAHHWTEAAALAAKRASDAQTAVNLDSEHRPQVVLHWKCLAELMRWYGGDKGAVDRVRALAPGEDSACRPELVEMTTGAEQDQLLLRGATDQARSRVYRTVGFEDWRLLTLEQVLAGQSVLTRDSVATALARGENMSAWQPGLWVTAIAPEPSDGPAEGQFAYYTARVVPDVYDGNLAAAHRDVDRASAIAATLDPIRYERRELAILPALVDLYGPKADTPFDNRFAEDHESLAGELQRFLMSGIYLRHGLPIDPSAVFGTDLEALQAAERGDGSRLVTQMTMPYHSWSAHDVLAVLPRITTGRAGVMFGLRWGPNGDQMNGYGFPWRTLTYIAERRALFELGGDPAEAARWAEIYARYRTAITDRKVLLSLAAWDLE